MTKVLVLGHKGMLGNAVYKYFQQKKEKYILLTAEKRWPNQDFQEILRASEAEIIINCIGLIPQRNPPHSEYEKINIQLPTFLDSLGKKIIHPSTDCEFLGNLGPNEKYKKTHPRDAIDDYGKSKAKISQLIEDSFKNTKVIRVSIIGHEEKNHLALLDWFLNSTGEVSGYTNQYWNGITTLEWAALSENLIDNWNTAPIINQYGTNDIRSKYDLLCDIKNIYNKDITIVPVEKSEGTNKCLESDKEIKNMSEQLRELKKFYNK